MSKVSVVIPARNELFLFKTVKDLLAKAAGDIEVIAVIDGDRKNPLATITDDPRLKVIHHKEPLGMRACINAGAALATGKYLMKSDGHCMFEEGYDVKLKADMEDNWVVIPRRYRLDAENWCFTDDPKPPIDLHYFSCPITNPDSYSMHAAIWPERDVQRLDVLLDETMTFQGSCWFMNRAWFTDFLKGMSEHGYGDYCQEPAEIGNKTWLGGGKVIVNKKVWYAHLHKGKRYGRGYFQNKADIIRGHEWGGRHWINDQEPGMLHKFEWLVEKFWPVPTWPEDWRNYKNEWRGERYEYRGTKLKEKKHE